MTKFYAILIPVQITCSEPAKEGKISSKSPSKKYSEGWDALFSKSKETSKESSHLN